jgi:hypothetical protein
LSMAHLCHTASTTDGLPLSPPQDYAKATAGSFPWLFK